MFRITAYHDDRSHPLHGDVVTVASVSEAMAIVEDTDDDLSAMLPGERTTGYSYACEYLIERI